MYVLQSVILSVYIYEVYGSFGPMQSAQYVSRAEYTMVVKEKRLLQHYLYNAVSSAVTLTHEETLMARIFTSKKHMISIMVASAMDAWSVVLGFV